MINSIKQILEKLEVKRITVITEDEEIIKELKKNGITGYWRKRVPIQRQRVNYSR
jgi:GTP cyclohydrolase II